LSRIWVVDDQPDIRELVKAILSLRSHDVTPVENGVAALELLAGCEQHPELVVLDVQMPDIDGWDTLSEIRLRYGDFGPRVVMCTVKGHPRDLLHGWTLGCDGYVWKPFDLKVMTAEVASVLARDDDERARVRQTAIGEARMLLRSAV
jgi:two-component system, OmpR family, response regulator